MSREYQTGGDRAGVFPVKQPKPVAEDVIDARLLVWAASDAEEGEEPNSGGSGAVAVRWASRRAALRP